MRPYRVLTIDGGGIRGLYSAVLLHGLAQRVAVSNGRPSARIDVGRGFDLIVGTSTGALLGVALAAGVALEDVIQLYRREAAAIFPDPTPASGARLWRWIAKHLRRSSASSEALRTALSKSNLLGDETVQQMYERRGIALCVPTVDAQSQKPWVYKTPHDTVGNRLQRDNEYRLVDVCMASAAAPIVFPLYGVPKPNDPAGHINWFVDGGLWANNPVMVAIIEALSFAPKDAPIEVVSVSTCPPFKADGVDRRSFDRGLVGWKGGIRVLEMALDSQSSAYDYMAKTLTTEMDGRLSYIRLSDPEISAEEAQELRMDNPSEACLDALIRLGHRAVDLNISEATTGRKTKALIMNVFADLPEITAGT